MNGGSKQEGGLRWSAPLMAHELRRFSFLRTGSARWRG